MAMPTFEDFVVKLMTDPQFAADFLSPTSDAPTRRAHLKGMGFTPPAIDAAEAVFNSPALRANIKALMANMTLAPAGVATGQSLRN